MSADDPAVSFDRPAGAGSDRVRAARAALQAALEVPGVLGSDAGPGGVRVTADPDSGPLIGVSATAQPDGRYALDLSLVADIVPLPALGEEVRDRVRTRAGSEHLEDVLGAVNVEFASVLTAEEYAAAVAELRVEEAIIGEELAEDAAIAEEAGESTARESDRARDEAEDAAARSGGAGAVRESEQRSPLAEAAPSGQEVSAAAAALAARQAALATDQAALAAKQAALAAELAALAGERAALAAGAVAPLFESESAGSVAEGEERET